MVGETLPELEAALAAFAAGDQSSATVGEAAGAGRRSVVFLFTGQGAQYAGMGGDLYAHELHFRAALDACARSLAEHVDRPLQEILFGAESEQLLERMEYAQPALCALQVALAALWRSWGIEPDVVAGHSAGEYAAAIVAGVMSQDEGLALSAIRGRLMAQAALESSVAGAPGTMAAVFADAAHVAALLERQGDALSIAAVNGPDSVVISGERVAVGSMLATLLASGIESRRLAVGVAAHSPLMDPMLDRFEQAVRATTLHPPQIAFVSGLTGEVAGAAEVTDPAYWRRQTREPVRFDQVLETLRVQGAMAYVEIGPHPTLIGIAQRAWGEAAATWAPSLRRDHAEPEQMLRSLGALFVSGVGVQWQGLYGAAARPRVLLPTYPFERERYRLQHTPQQHGAAATRALCAGTPAAGRACRVACAAGDRLRRRTERAATGLSGPPPHSWRRSAAVTRLCRDGTLRRGAGLGRNALPHREFDHSRSHGAARKWRPGRADSARLWRRSSAFPDLQQANARRRLAAALRRAARQGHCARAGTLVSRVDVLARCSEEIEGAAYYARLAEMGLEFGESYQGLKEIWRRDGEAIGLVELPASLSADFARYGFHPALLDSCFHLLGAPLPEDHDSALLVGIDHLQVLGAPMQRMWCHVQLRAGFAQDESIVGDLRVYTEAGGLVAEATGLHLKRTTRAALLQATRRTANDWFYKLAWEQLPAPVLQSGAAGQPHAAFGAAMEDRFTALAAEHALAQARGQLSQLEALSTNHTLQALAELGWRPRVGEKVSASTLATQLGVQPSHQRLFARMLALAEAEGLLQRNTGDALAAHDDAASWTVLSEALVPAAGAHSEVPLAEGNSAISAEAALIARCGPSLAPALRGDVDALELLFPDGSLALTEPLYRDTPAARVFNTLIAEAVHSAVRRAAERRTQANQGGPVRILEIGAGSGGTTAHLLPRLAGEHVDYLFTDLSPLFTTRARERFAAYPFVRYARFDVEREPAAQDIQEGGFDVVIAANVLHATADLRTTVANVRRTLAPDGTLVLLEGVRPRRWVDITFGLTEGWWRFADRDLRPNHPLLGQAAWHTLLEEAGFDAVESMPPQAEESDQVILLAHATAAAADGTGADKGACAPWLIFAASGGVGESIADALRAQGAAVDLAVPGSGFAQLADDRWAFAGATADGYEKLFAALPETSAARRVVDLAALDAPAAADQNAEALLANAQVLCGEAIALAQAAVTHDTRLWLVTRNAQAVTDGEAPDPAQASLWGIGRVLALEHPAQWGGLVDLVNATADSDRAAVAQWLLDRVNSASNEDALALRNGKTYAPRLQRAVGPRNPPQPRAPGVAWRWCVFGDGRAGRPWLAGGQAAGTEWRGLHSAAGSPRITPRAEWATLPAESQAASQVKAIAEMEAQGARVEIVAADVADRAAMTELFTRFGAALPPLRGIIHAAADLSNWPVPRAAGRCAARAAARQGGRRPPAGRVEQQPCARFLRSIFIHHRIVGRTRSGSLCGGQPGARCACPGAARAGFAGALHQLGHMGKHPRGLGSGAARAGRLWAEPHGGRCGAGCAGRAYRSGRKPRRSGVD